jgi:hypothetical protein
MGIGTAGTRSWASTRNVTQRDTTRETQKQGTSDGAFWHDREREERAAPASRNHRRGAPRAARGPALLPCRSLLTRKDEHHGEVADSCVKRDEGGGAAIDGREDAP